MLPAPQDLAPVVLALAVPVAFVIGVVLAIARRRAVDAATTGTQR